MTKSWTTVPGFPTYEVNREGWVRRIGGKIILKPCNNNQGYPMVNLSMEGKSHIKTVHKLVWTAFKGSVPEGKIIDHIDEDRTNARLSNLRLFTKSMNKLGTKSKCAASAFRGVYHDSVNKKWRALHTVNGKLEHLGRYNTETEAALIRDYHTYKTHGDSARLNFPMLTSLLSKELEAARQEGRDEMITRFSRFLGIEKMTQIVSNSAPTNKPID